MKQPLSFLIVTGDTHVERESGPTPLWKTGSTFLKIPQNKQKAASGVNNGSFRRPRRAGRRSGYWERDGGQGRGSGLQGAASSEPAAGSVGSGVVGAGHLRRVAACALLARGRGAWVRLVVSFVYVIARVRCRPRRPCAPCVSRLPPVFWGFCGDRTDSPTHGALLPVGVLTNDTRVRVDSHSIFQPSRILLHVRNNNAACFELVAAAGGRIQHEQLNSTRLLLGMPMLPNGSTHLPNGHIGLDKD